jgi:metallophosphoesterase superfamily enzyme
MGVRSDLVGWSDAECRRLAKLFAEGSTTEQVVETLNREFHGGRKVRNFTAVRLKRGKLKVWIGPKKHQTPLTPPVLTEQQVETRATEDATEVKSVGSKIKSVEDLLRHIQADLTRFEIERSEATKWETATVDPQTGKPVVTELHRVFVRLKPKAGPSAEELIQSLIDGAGKLRRTLITPRVIKSRSTDVLQALVIADPHIGKYAWAEETGWQDYDIGIAKRLLQQAAGQLLEEGEYRKVGKRAIFLLGDYFHYDTPDAKTTKGTPLERDGRMEKMVEEGAAILFDILEQSASIPTEVVLVNGNHDTMLTVALRHILKAYFRNDKRITLNDAKTSRKYYTHGKVLIGLTHGDKGKKRLGEIMPAEVPHLWGTSTYREWHTGHLHGEAEVQTVGGVVIRTAPALCPPDGWHSAEGYVGKPRGMQTFFYHSGGSLLGMSVSNPDQTP